jgi:hypothetical protein
MKFLDNDRFTWVVLILVNLFIWFQVVRAVLNWLFK